MKKALILILIFANIVCFSQEKIFFNSKKSLKKIEVRVKDKINTVSDIEDDLLIYLKANNLLQKNLDCFYFIDCDCDGLIEIVYTGDAGTEGKRTLIFEQQSSKYVKIFDRFGEIVGVQQFNLLCPLSFVLKENAHSGNSLEIYELFSPTRKNDKIELKSIAKYAVIEGTKIPNTINNSRLFEVKNDIYYLRLEPQIDNLTFNEDLRMKGNIIAEFKKGARGYSLAESIDSTGRVWWFVAILNNDHLSSGMFDFGSNNVNDYMSIGWMSSKYLKLIEN